jgi:menaquinol-cytochrome c reductase cytochrome b subunit
MGVDGRDGIQEAVVGWVDDRLPFVDAVDAELYRRVPNYTLAFHRYLGGMALIILVIELITGFLLGIYYVPDGAGNPAPAYSSVQFIQHTAYLGWLIRGTHFWGASLLLVVVVLHMTFVFWTGGYRAPRELNWMIGVVVFLAVMLLALTGSLLPWDANSYFARAREISIASGASVLPSGVSGFIRDLIQGGPIVGPETLLRFYMLHVVLLPAAIVALVFIHLKLVRRQGPSQPL